MSMFDDGLTIVAIVAIEFNGSATGQEHTIVRFGITRSRQLTVEQITKNSATYESNDE